MGAHQHDRLELAAVRPAGRGQAGLVSLQAILVEVVAVAVFVWLLQLAVFTYGRAVVRSAVDDGARAGTLVSDSVGRCQDRAQQTLDGLLAGSMGRGVSVSCSDDGTTVLARADVRFLAWAPAMPDWDFTVTATARKTPVP